MGRVAAVDLLDDGFAQIAAGEVEVDVGPRRASVGTDAAFAEETFKEEAVFDGVDRGDAEGVADDAVGGGAPALHQDTVGAGPFAEVGDDEKVTAEAEFFDESEFGVDLLAVAGGEAGDEVADAGVNEAAEVRGHGVPRRDGEVGKLVAEVLEREFEAVGEAGGVRDGGGQIGEFFGHASTGADLTFGVGGEELSGAVEGGVVSQTSEYVGNGPRGAVGVGDATGGEEGEALVGGQIAEKTDEAFFAANAVALHFDVEAVGAEKALEVGEGSGDGGGSAGLPGRKQGAFGVTGERDEAGGVGGDFIPGGEAGAFAFAEVGTGGGSWWAARGWRSGSREVGGSVRSRGQAVARRLFGVGDELAEVLVAGAVGREERQDGAVEEGDLGTDEGAYAGGGGRVVEAGGAIKSVAIAEGHGREFEARGGGREVARHRGSPQEAERARGVEFDVRRRRQGRSGGRWAAELRWGAG